jgi:hypothetical protein
MPTATPTPVRAVETAHDFKQRTQDVLFAQEQGILLSSRLNLKPLEEPSGLTRIPITWPVQDLNMF